VTAPQAAEWPLLFAGNISTGDEPLVHSHDVAFSPDGGVLAFGLPDGSVHLWALESRRGRVRRPSDYELSSLQSLKSDDGAVCSLAFSPDATILAAGARDGAVHLWRTTDGKRVQSLMGHELQVVSLAFSPDGNALASASLDRTVRVWEISTGDVTHELEQPWAMTAVAFSPDGSLLAVGGADDDSRQLLSTEDWSRALALESAGGGLGSLAFSPDGTMLAAGNALYQVLRWCVADGRLMQAAEAHTDSVNSVAFSPDGRRLASASLDGTVKLWYLP
jgi:WD40 repeat protein